MTAVHHEAIEPQAATLARRLDLDWLRIGAFGLLILYHIAMFFGPWEWHLNSRHAQPWVSVVMVATNPWRLTLLFLISGVAVRYMATKLPPAGLALERSRRLLVPMVFGILVLVPPQAYIEQLVKHGREQGYLAYWARFLTVEHGLCSGVACTPFPVNHLWFIGYVWAYSLVAALLMWRPAWVRSAETVVARVLSGPGALLLPAFYLVAIRLWLYPTFGVTNHLLWDPCNHAASLGVFLLGFLLAFHASFWSNLDRLRWWALLAAVPSGLYLAADAALPIPAQHPTASGMMIAFALNQWAMIAALLGFAHRHLRTLDGPVLAYLREGVFPFYLVHQTIIVVAAYWLERWNMPGVPEAAALLAVTIIGSMLAFELARRIKWLGPLLGLRMRRSRAPRREAAQVVPRIVEGGA